MKYIITVELDLGENEIIGAKEQICNALENIGTAHITNIKEKEQ